MSGSTLFSTVANLEIKPLDFQRYYSGQSSAVSLTPLNSSRTLGPPGGVTRSAAVTTPNLGMSTDPHQIALAFGIPINKDMVRRILAVRYEPKPDSAGPSWLTVLGHAKDQTPIAA
jgi:hypothetical protein